MNAPETTPQGGGTAVSRKEFLGLAMLGAVGAARPRLTRGPLIAMIGGGVAWRNPYVTDGLIAMWDGEWNSGVGGEHDSSATAWTDLISGLGSNVNIPSSMRFDTKSLAVSSRDGNFVSHDFGLFTGLCDSILDSHAGTCEFVFEASESASVGVKSTLLFPNTWFAFDSRYYTASTFKSRVGFNRIGLGTSDLTGIIDIRNSYSALSFDSTTATGWESGMSIFTKPCTEISDVNTRQFSVSTNSRVYAIRLYNRSLTEVEIAANYAIDKARFGLT